MYKFLNECKKILEKMNSDKYPFDLFVHGHVYVVVLKASKRETRTMLFEGECFLILKCFDHLLFFVSEPRKGNFDT